MVKTLMEQFRATGNVTGKKIGGSKPRVSTPDTVGTIHVSVASSPMWKSARQPQKMRYHPRQHGAYFKPIYTCIRTRSMSSSLWQLRTQKSGQGLVRNSVITSSRTLTLFLWGYLKEKVFSSAPWTLPALKERIKLFTDHKRNAHSCCTELVLHLQAVRESQEAHIEHVIHNATHVWNSNPCLLLWHCFHIIKFAMTNALLSWKWQ